MSLNPQDVGRRLRQARDAKGWTQLEAASNLRVSPSSIQRWESGKLPPVRELIRVAAIYEVPTETLVEPAPEPEGRPQGALLREVAAGVGVLAVDMRDVRAQLDRIEQLLSPPEAGRGQPGMRTP